jgi:hypothetical protein
MSVPTLPTPISTTIVDYSNPTVFIRPLLTAAFCFLLLAMVVLLAAFRNRIKIKLRKILKSFWQSQHRQPENGESTIQLFFTSLHFILI